MAIKTNVTYNSTIVSRECTMKRLIRKWLGVEQEAAVEFDTFLAARTLENRINLRRLMDYLGVEMHTETEKTYVREKKK